MSYLTNNMTNIEGTSLTLCLILTGQVITFISGMQEVVLFLQGVSFLLAITVAIDTLIGSPLRTYLTSLYKQRKTKK